MKRRQLSVLDLKREMHWTGSIATIYTWLAGRNRPRVDTRHKLAQVLRIDVLTLEHADDDVREAALSGLRDWWSERIDPPPEQEVSLCPHHPDRECPASCWADLPPERCLHDT